jgi:trans-aconitate methyltransferase
MELDVAVSLIKDGVAPTGEPQQWADLGAGTGLFTQALASLLPDKSTIYAIDRDADILRGIASPNPLVAIESMQIDFATQKMAVTLDGLMFANSLHFIDNKKATLQKWMRCLKSPAKIIIVEYDLHQRNAWVPFPITYNVLRSLAGDLGCNNIFKLAETPSRYNHSKIYAAVLSC